MPRAKRVRPETPAVPSKVSRRLNHPFVPDSLQEVVNKSLDAYEFDTVFRAYHDDGNLLAPEQFAAATAAFLRQVRLGQGNSNQQDLHRSRTENKFDANLADPEPALVRLAHFWQQHPSASTAVHCIVCRRPQQSFARCSWGQHPW